MNRRGRKKAFENTESGSGGSKRKVSRRQDESTDPSGEIVPSVKTASTNRLKRRKSEPIEISSDEEIPVERKPKNCIASRTRSKANHYSPLSQNKKPKLGSSHSSSVSPATDGNIATLGSNIRKTSTRHHNTESANISASRRTPVGILATAPETNSINNNVRTIPFHSFPFFQISNKIQTKFECKTYFNFFSSSSKFTFIGVTIVKSGKSIKT